MVGAKCRDGWPLRLKSNFIIPHQRAAGRGEGIFNWTILVQPHALGKMVQRAPGYVLKVPGPVG